MIRLQPYATLTDSFFPYTSLFRSAQSRSIGDAGPLSGISPASGLVQGGGAAVVSVAPAAGVCGVGLCVVNRGRGDDPGPESRSEEHTSELQSLMSISYAVFCLKKKYKNKNRKYNLTIHSNII